MGITNLDYTISAGEFLLQVKVTNFSSTYLIFQVIVNQNSYLRVLSLTYMALDNSFTPAFSMNYFFPQLNQYANGVYAQYYVNFTASTGVVLNTSH